MHNHRRTISSCLLLLVVVAGGVVASSPGAGETKDNPPWEARTRITVDIDQLEYIDGDTMRYRDFSIRFLGCDTPEKSCGFFEGDQEPYATQADTFMREQIQEAELVELETIENRDSHRRLLGHFFVDGESLSLILVRERHAYETISRYGDNGYPEIAEDIMEAAGYAFYNPHEWREQNRR